MGLLVWPPGTLKKNQPKSKHQNKAKWTKPPKPTRERRKKNPPRSELSPPPLTAGKEVVCFVLMLLCSSAFMPLLTVCEHTSWISYRTQIHHLIEKNITSGHTFLLQRKRCWKNINILNICGRFNPLILYSKGSFIHDLWFLFKQAL